ncbi:hypothetical protein ACFXHA_28170 [Nocardia sp. NPDC059240]|uniref:hypothetical protein n=1 Tax=Nocardia sp. NPDC059240 TaxID=3346786 RepID=UPI00369F29FE
MTTRLLIGLSAAALFTGAVGALAPAAFATDLAEGVSCVDLTCRNDTDDIYVVRVRVNCTGMVGPETMSIAVNRHSTRHVYVSCPDSKGPWSDSPPRTNWVTSVEYLSAVVNNSIPTGSAG